MAPTRTRFFALAGLLACLVRAQSAHYELTIDGVALTAKVRITLPDAIAKHFRMPAWGPGDYRIVDFGRNLKGVTFTRKGIEVGAQHGIDENLWAVPEGADTVTYSVPKLRPGIFCENLRILPNEAFVNGAAVLGYFEEDQFAPQTITLNPYPATTSTVVCALEKKTNTTFTAANYDDLIDAPIVVGDSIVLKPFAAEGKNHTVVAFGRNVAGFDAQSFTKLGADLAVQCKKLFGELPYKQYYFLFDVGGPGGGLEHANCARLAMWRNASPSSAYSFVAHEYFHCYNVKRIRAIPLGPFDYSKPAITGALWWLEGVTDYYAEIITCRAGYQTKAQLLNKLSGEASSLSRTPARLKVSADESSRRVWEAGNSSGYGGLDYYAKGKLIGWCLDMAIRAHSSGERSLDDVIVALYNECKNGKPGFSEKRIRELAIKFGGEELGPLYDKCVLQATELPIQTLLPFLGMKWSGGAVIDDAADGHAKKIGEKWPFSVRE